MKKIYLAENLRMLTDVPTDWSELTDRQKRYVFKLKAEGWSAEMVRAFCLVRFTHLKVVRHIGDDWFARFRHRLTVGKTFLLNPESLRKAFDCLKFTDGFDSSPRMERLGGYRAVDVILREVPFVDYLNMERYYQQYLSTRVEKNLEELLRLLYRRRNGKAARLRHVSNWQKVAAFYWYSFIKKQYSTMFPHFFRPATEATKGGRQHRYMEAVNAQIRALTDGDVTKEKQILSTDTLRALAELDAKALEAAEIKKKMKRQ